LAKKHEDRTFWLKFDALKLAPSFGWTTVNKAKRFSHSYEASWADLQGFWGHPLILTAGGSYRLSKASSMLYTIQGSKYF
jgi:hypothetical protein